MYLTSSGERVFYVHLIYSINYYELMLLILTGTGSVNLTRTWYHKIWFLLSGVQLLKRIFYLSTSVIKGHNRIRCIRNNSVNTTLSDQLTCTGHIRLVAIEYCHTKHTINMGHCFRAIYSRYFSSVTSYSQSHQGTNIATKITKYLINFQIPISSESNNILGIKTLVLFFNSDD